MLPEEQEEQEETVIPNDEIGDESTDDFADAFNEPEEGEEYEEIAADENADADLDSQLKEELDGDGDGEQQQQKPAEELSELDQLKAENERLNHRIQSDGGRTSALQKQINDFKYAEKQRNDPANVKVDSEAMKLLKEDYPDIADAIQGEISRGIAESTQRIDARVQESMAPMQQAEEERLASIEAETLSNAHPDYLDLNVDKNYWDWVAQQSPARQQAAKSQSSIDVIETLNLYKYSTGYQPKGGDQGVQSKRQKQLDAMRGVPSKKGSGHRKTIAKDDFAGGFNS